SVFFQAEDGIRDFHVTGVQTCALPISAPRPATSRGAGGKTSRAARGCRARGGARRAAPSLDRSGAQLPPSSPPRRARRRRACSRSEERRVGKECGGGVVPPTVIKRPVL